jgi:hypothetical protein
VPFFVFLTPLKKAKKLDNTINYWYLGMYLPREKAKNDTLNPKRKGGDGKGIPIFKRILFKIEGGDYEGVQSFLKGR